MYRTRWLDAARRLLLIAGTTTLLPSPARAEVSFEGSLPSDLEMETSYTVRWSTDADNVKITMVSGSESSDNIYHLYDLVCNIWLVNNLSNACTTTETSLDWKPPDDLPIGHYMLMATAADDTTAFSNQFNLVEADDASSTGGSSGSSSGGSTITSAPAGSTASLITSVFTSSSAGSAQVITSVITQAPGATGTDPTPDTGSSGGGGLSTGAKAGIGVGAAVGALVLFGGLGFVIFRMGKRAADHKKENADEDKGKEGEEAASGDAKNLADAEAGAVAELQAPVKVHEAPDYKTRLTAPGKNEFVSELDATGGSFMIPQTSRPATGTSAAGAAAEGTDKAGAAESADKAGQPPAKDGDEEGTAKKAEDGPSTSAAAGGEERASTSSGPPKSVRYETPDDIGRPPDQK